MYTNTIRIFKYVLLHSNAMIDDKCLLYIQLSPSEREAHSGRVYELEEEVGRLKRELIRGREGELYETRGRCEQLTRTIEALEEQLRQQVIMHCIFIFISIYTYRIYQHCNS